MCCERDGKVVSWWRGKLIAASVACVLILSGASFGQRPTGGGKGDSGKSDSGGKTSGGGQVSSGSRPTGGSSGGSVGSGKSDSGGRPSGGGQISSGSRPTGGSSGGSVGSGRGQGIGGSVGGSAGRIGGGSVGSGRGQSGGGQGLGGSVGGSTGRIGGGSVGSVRGQGGGGQSNGGSIGSGRGQSGGGQGLGGSVGSSTGRIGGGSVGAGRGQAGGGQGDSNSGGIGTVGRGGSVGVGSGGAIGSGRGGSAGSRQTNGGVGRVGDSQGEAGRGERLGIPDRTDKGSNTGQIRPGGGSGTVDRSGSKDQGTGRGKYTGAGPIPYPQAKEIKGVKPPDRSGNNNRGDRGKGRGTIVNVGKVDRRDGHGGTIVNVNGWRNGYCHYDRNWCDRNWFWDSYCYSPIVNYCTPSLYYYYGCLPGYIWLPRVIFCNRPVIVYIESAINWTYCNKGYYLEQPSYSSLDRAVSDIVDAWRLNDASRLERHIAQDTQVAVYLDGQYSYSLEPYDFAAISRDAIQTVRSKSFTVDRVARRNNDMVVVYATHTFVNADDFYETVYVAYTLERTGNEWFITEAGSSHNRLLK